MLIMRISNYGRMDIPFSNTTFAVPLLESLFFNGALEGLPRFYAICLFCGEYVAFMSIPDSSAPYSDLVPASSSE